MIEQSEIYRMAQSGDVKERRWAVYQLRSNFADLPDKEQAWAYLRKFLRDKDSFVRERTADAIGSIFSHIPDKEQAWADLQWLVQCKNSNLLCSAVFSLGLAFPYVPDKNQAWDELIWLAMDKKKGRFVRWCIANALGSAFPHVPDKNQAWADLIWITRHIKNSDVRWEVVAALGSAFPHVPDKNQAWADLIQLTQYKDNYVRGGVALVLSSAIPHILDNEKAWSDLIHLIQDQDIVVSRGAADALIPAFPHVPDKNKAWVDLIILARYTDSFVSRVAADALGSAFAHLPDKNKAWVDLIRFIHDKDSKVRRVAADALGSAFAHLPDKNQAWVYLIQLTHDKDSNVRRVATDALGLVFPHVLDKEQILETLKGLTKDENSSVRASAEYSLGRASIFKATEAHGKEDFRKELENALEFFEIASKEVSYSPACFCLPFYRSFYAITFRNQEVEIEIEVQTYLIEAKSELEGSESKEKLLEAVENLSNALKELQKARDFDEIKCDLNAYRQYCENAANLLNTTKEKAPRATELIRKGLPIIEERIKEIISEIQKNSIALCKSTRGTPFEDLGKEVNRHGQALLQIRDLRGLEKGINHMQITLSAICAKMPEEERGEACELLKKANEELYIEDKVNLINIILGKVSSQLSFQTILEELKSELKSRFNRIEKNIDDIAQGNEVTRNLLIGYANKTQGILLKLLDESKNCESETQKLVKEFSDEITKKLEEKDEKWLEIFKNNLIKQEPKIEKELSSAPEIKSKWYKWIDYIKNKIDKETIEKEIKEIMQKLPTEAVVMISAEKILEYGVPFLSAVMNSSVAVPAIITILYAIRGVFPKDK